MKNNDLTVIAAMGDKFAQLQTLARMCYEDPSTRSYAEAQMAKILDSMSQEERVELRRQLLRAQRDRS